MCCLKVLLGLVLLLGLTPDAHAEAVLGRGDLTIVVRTAAGAPVAGVTLQLFVEADDGSRQALAPVTTDPTGTVVLRGLAWGIYIVQFQGTAPDGRPLQPAADQNQGLLDDGAGVAGGFGVRFAEATRTELFVLTTLPGTPHAVPLFDLATSRDAPPEPYDPVIALAAQGPTPTPFLLRDVVDGRVDLAGQPLPPRGRWDGWCLAGLALLLWAVSVAVVLGWLRSQGRAPRADTPEGEDTHGGLD